MFTCTVFLFYFKYTLLEYLSLTAKEGEVSYSCHLPVASQAVAMERVTFPKYQENNTYIVVRNL